MGASVDLVTASDLPVALDVIRSVRTIRVDTASAMGEAMLASSAHADVVIMAAAVADFRAVPATQKLKRTQGTPSLELEPTVDILASLVAQRLPGQIVVGFAAETRDLEAQARAKFEAKGLDLLVANDVSRSDIGFDATSNEVLLVDREGVTAINRQSKEAIAQVILDKVISMKIRGDQ
jgi:phosphopantothenoylcysteine decarboxylase/phosphopantothenate--cysteine ligase